MTEIYRKAANRQRTGTAFHHDAYLFFRFLGLDRFAGIQRHRYSEEKATLDKIMLRCLCRCDTLIEPKQEAVDVIPSEVYNTKASSVGNEYKRKALIKFMQKWKEWEEYTEKFYAELAGASKDSPDTLFFSDLARDVSQEIAYLHDLDRLFELAGYELVQVENLSATCLH